MPLDNGDGESRRCPNHDVPLRFQRNRARSNGGQWKCRICDNLRQQGKKVRWKLDHPSPLDYHLSQCLWRSRSHSRRINREHTITLSELRGLWWQQRGRCAITRDVMQWKVGDKKRNRRAISIDRIDSARGYTPNNVWLVCEYANRAKSDLTPNELLRFCAGYLLTTEGALAVEAVRKKA